MKLVLIAYNEALDEEVGEILRTHAVEGFTKWTKTYGQGNSSGPHMGSHIWPKVNNVLAIVTEDETATRLLEGVRTLRERLAHEGVKAFVLPCEDLT